MTVPISAKGDFTSPLNASAVVEPDVRRASRAVQGIGIWSIGGYAAWNKQYTTLGRVDQGLYLPYLQDMLRVWVHVVNILFFERAITIVYWVYGRLNYPL